MIEKSLLDATLKPVPAFYCCYLLRSTVRHSSLYIGSTPHPVRRIAQHNGKVKGGAVRTSRLKLQPWEMVCIVAGFPSNIAALQFEWAWQNPHLTKHIAAESRISIPTERNKTDSRTGKKRKRPGRPRTSLIDKLSNLHLLLRAPYFSTWPLELRFFNAGVHSSWLAWDQRVDQRLENRIQVFLDLPQDTEEADHVSSSQRAGKKAKANLIGRGGIDGIDPSYAQLRPVFQKLKDQLEDDRDAITCDLCRKNVDVESQLFTICLATGCCSMNHVSCLSSHCLRKETELLVPIEGKCPKCRTLTKWADLMKMLTLRMRAEKKVTKLLKKRRGDPTAIAADLLDEDEDENLDMLNEDSDIDADLDEEPESGSDDEDDASITSLEPSQSHLNAPQRSAAAQWVADMLEVVIEDSEDES